MSDPTNGIGAALRYAFRTPLTGDPDAERITERLTLHEQVQARFEEEERRRLQDHHAQVNRVLRHLKNFVNGAHHG